ncbi:MAG: MoaD/ThiS family protein [Spirochaetaceae bacterium]|nr:MAG: MoaD/ThiS family protein [Spirochaetaceae bacterium]
MSVAVRYFGPLLDVTGREGESIELELPATVARIEEEILRVHPELRQREFRIAVDETFRERDEVVEGAREVALLPAFSGG